MLPSHAEPLGTLMSKRNAPSLKGAAFPSAFLRCCFALGSAASFTSSRPSLLPILLPALLLGLIVLPTPAADLPSSPFDDARTLAAASKSAYGGRGLLSAPPCWLADSSAWSRDLAPCPLFDS